MFRDLERDLAEVRRLEKMMKKNIREAYDIGSPQVRGILCPWVEQTGGVDRIYLARIEDVTKFEDEKE